MLSMRLSRAMTEMRDIPSYPDYAATEDGQIWSKRRHKFMRQQISRVGYKVLVLTVNGKSIYRNVHRLVAEAFIPNPNNLATVNHKNEIKTDNRVCNLEWMSTLDNVRYGTGIQRKAESHKKPILQVSRSGEIVERFDSLGDAAKKTNISMFNISAAAHGKKYRPTAGGYFWRYE